jgi:nucleoside-diphosphate-sugar epimerase
VRFHNIFGPLGTYDGGREKSPAAICRKVALVADGGEIEVWGDGEQTRSYCFIDDCVEGIFRLMQSDHREPLNLGTDRLVSINELVDLVAEAAGKTVQKRYNLSAPQGVRGRNSDNTQLRDVLGWEPGTTLEAGLAVTYRWIRGEMAKQSDTYQLDAGGAVQGSDLALAGLRDSAEEMSAAD